MFLIPVLKTLCKKGAAYRLMSYDGYKQQLHWHSKMVYRRSHSNGTDTTPTVNNTLPGKHERQGSEEDSKISQPDTAGSQGKLKRPLSHDSNGGQIKKLKGSDAGV